MTEEELRLGMKARDVISGFTGVAVGHCRYVSGCSQVMLQPPCGEDGKLADNQWFDVQRLQAVGNEVIILDNYLTPGFDQLPPKRN